VRCRIDNQTGLGDFKAGEATPYMGFWSFPFGAQPGLSRDPSEIPHDKNSTCQSPPGVCKSYDKVLWGG